MRFFSIFSVFLLMLFFGCTSEDRNNSRVYIEGKITGNNIFFDEVSINAFSNDKNIATAIPESSGDFVLSGPLLSDSFHLVFNRKIESFSSSKNGCTLSADSLKILVPSGVTYITFNEIELK